MTDERVEAVRAVVENRATVLTDPGLKSWLEDAGMEASEFQLAVAVRDAVIHEFATQPAEEIARAAALEAADDIAFRIAAGRPPKPGEMLEIIAAATAKVVASRVIQAIVNALANRGVS